MGHNYIENKCVKKNPQIYFYTFKMTSTPTCIFFFNGRGNHFVFNGYMPTSFLGGQLGKWKFLARCQKNIWEELPCDIGHRPICEK